MATKKRSKPKPRVREVGPREPGEETLEEWSKKLTPTEKRIDEIVQKMLAGAWLTGVSERALAREWNVSPITVRGLAAEASRLIRARLRLDPKAQEEALAAIIQTFEVIQAKAMAKGDAPSLRVALDATRARGFYLGIEPAKRLDVSNRTNRFEGWTTDEKLAFIRDGRRPRRASNRIAETDANGSDDTPVH